MANKAKYTRVTTELVEKVKDFAKRFPEMSQREIASYTEWTSVSTISRILNGDYDYMLEGQEKEPNSVDISNLTEEIRTFRERYMTITEDQHIDIMDVLTANNALLADIATMLVNHIECPEHKGSKQSEAHFRDKIKSNRR